MGMLLAAQSLYAGELSADLWEPEAPEEDSWEENLSADTEWESSEVLAEYGGEAAGLWEGSLVEASNSGKWSENVTWKLNKRTLTISGSEEMYSYLDKENGDVPWMDKKDQIKKIVV